MDVSTVGGRRVRAIIAVMTYTRARVGAVVAFRRLLPAEKTLANIVYLYVNKKNSGERLKIGRFCDVERRRVSALAEILSPDFSPSMGI